MYQQYFGLAETPFSIAVNPRYLFMSQRHREALAHLLYGVGSGGFILLTGEVGTGKTTLTRCLLEQLPEQTDVAIVLNPALDALELLAAVCDELGISHRGHASTLKELTDSLHHFLLANHARERRTVLLIDEAQHLGLPVLEQIRLLTNLETHDEKLLQIILVGQPELAVLLQRPELRQLNQRITARFNLTPLSRDETRAYIRHRLEVAGLPADRELFPVGISARVHRLTGGIPRLINLLCDRVLLGAYGRGEERASRCLLDQAASEVLGSRPADVRTWGWRKVLASLLVPAVVAAVLLWWWATREEASGGVGTMSETSATAGLPEPVPVPGSTPVRDHVAAGGGLPVGARSELVAGESPTAAGEETPAWMLPPGEALHRVWQVLAPATEVATIPATLEKLCRGGEITRPLGCLRATVDSWRELPDGTRPVVLELKTSRGYLAAGIWLGADGNEGLLWAPAAVSRVPLLTLAEHWNGNYTLLWHPPEDFQRPLGPGSEGEAVADVARRFAELDEQTEPLAGMAYNRRLEQRVRLFQLEEGLEVDGWVGVQTLLRLEERRQGRRSPEYWHPLLSRYPGED